MQEDRNHVSLSASPVASWDLADEIQTVEHSPAVKTHTLCAYFSMLDSLPSVRPESVKNHVASWNKNKLQENNNGQEITTWGRCPAPETKGKKWEIILSIAYKFLLLLFFLKITTFNNIILFGRVMQKGKYRNKWTLGCSVPGLYKYQSCLGMFVGFAKYRFWFNKFWWDQDSALTSSQVMLMVLVHRTHFDVHESRPECCNYVPKSRDRSGRQGDLPFSRSCSLMLTVARLITKSL